MKKKFFVLLLILSLNFIKVNAISTNMVLMNKTNEELINGYRFAKNNASANNNKIPCGMALYITKCYEENGTEYCEYNNGTSSGIVYRNALTIAVESAESTCNSNEHNDFGWRYASSEGIINTEFSCGAKLYITDCTSSICDFTKIEENGKIRNISGTVNRNYLSSNSDIANRCSKNKKEEEIEECVNTKKTDIKGTQTFSICYNNGLDDQNVKQMIYENNLISCSKDYYLDKTATRSNNNVTCDSKKCIREYTFSCMQNKNKSSISLSAEPTVADSTGYGIVKVKATTSSGNINGYYISDSYNTPTIRSNWESVSSGDFELKLSAGVKYLWVKDTNGQISSVVSVAVIDNINTSTTIKTLALKDEYNNDISVSSGSVISMSNYKGKYIRLSNTISKENIASGFNPFNSEYKVTVNSPTITVYATLTSNDAEFVPGYEPRTINLSYGINTILIKIRDKSGKERSYTILATRKDDRSSDNTLSNIKVSSGNIDFNSNKTEYNIVIPTDIKSVNVEATINSTLATYVSGFEPNIVNINSNNVVKLIKVKSETGSVRTYVLNFIKKGTEVINKESLQLMGLSIPGINIPFESSISNYNLTVDYTIDAIDIYSSLKNKNSSYNIRIIKSNSEYVNSSNLGIPLQVGENYIEIEVINSDGEKAVYRLNVLRKEFGLDVDNNTSLKELKVLGYKISFDKNKYDYTVKIKKEKTLVITAIPTSSRAEVFIRGNDELTGFSTVRIKVVAENGDNKTYSIDIKKDTYNKSIEYAAVIFGFVIIFISSCIIIKKKIENKKNYYKE